HGEPGRRAAAAAAAAAATDASLPPSRFPMDLRRLEVFAQVAQLGSFSRAADALSLTQPTVSAHVRALEDELGVQLLTGSAAALRPPTPADSSSATRAACSRSSARRDRRLTSSRGACPVSSSSAAPRSPASTCCPP